MSGQSNDLQNSLDMLLSFCKYLYEEERRRSERFHAAIKTYIVIIGATLGGVTAVLKWAGINYESLQFENQHVVASLFLVSLSLAFISILLSFVLTVLVIKGWRIERLCDAEDFVLQVSENLSHQDMCEKIISCYAVAASRNAEVNEKKYRIFHGASLSYRIGMLFLVISVLLYTFI